MKIKFLIITVLCLLTANFVLAQKAEPNRISFAKGKNSTTITGFLKSDEVAEYIFGAKAGQKVKVSIVSTTPKGKFHYFSLLGDGFDFATQYDKNFFYEFVAPHTGDYRLDVNFNATSKVTSGKYSLTLSIRKLGLIQSRKFSAFVAEGD